MRTLQTRLLSLLALLFAALTVVAIQGCSSTPDAPGGDGPSTNGPDVTPPGSAGDNGDDGVPDGPLVAVDDSVAAAAVGPGLTAGASMRATANVNLRKGPASSYAVLAVIPAGALVTLVSATPQNGFLDVDFNGTTGWCSATYLTEVAGAGGTTGGSGAGGTSAGGTSGGSGTGTGGAVDLEGAPSPANALARAKAAVGFSYYWGAGSWLPGGPTSSSKGSCSGSCPSCTHSGKYGADCSGLVAKAWQFGTKALEVDAHPYSTASFVSDSSGHWSTVSRASLKTGDALVYNSGGHGHIVLYEKGDGWGTPTVVECRGCAYGCVHNARSFSSTFHGIRRAGF